MHAENMQAYTLSVQKCNFLLYYLCFYGDSLSYCKISVDQLFPSPLFSLFIFLLLLLCPLSNLQSLPQECCGGWQAGVRLTTPGTTGGATLERASFGVQTPRQPFPDLIPNLRSRVVLKDILLAIPSSGWTLQLYLFWSRSGCHGGPVGWG